MRLSRAGRAWRWRSVPPRRCSPKARMEDVPLQGTTTVGTGDSPGSSIHSGPGPFTRGGLMTVGELIKTLQMMDPGRLVVMAADAEGNKYSPLYAARLGIYRPFNTWSGDVLGPGDTTVAGDQSCVVLVPVH